MHHYVNIFAVDLSKAFNLVDHELPLDKFANAGFGSKTLEWFKNYLTGRDKSDFLEITKGVPQGSIFGSYFIFCFYK